MGFHGLQPIFQPPPRSRKKSLENIGDLITSTEVCTHVSKLHLRFKDYEPMPASIVNGHPFAHGLHMVKFHGKLHGVRFFLNIFYPLVMSK